jgi:hypothetical protein
MPTGTDIYIISGVKKQAHLSELLPIGITDIAVMELSNGKRIVMPTSTYRGIMANYGRKRASIGAFTITADSLPAYDTWGWADYWGCTDWMQWHQANVTAYGKDTANQKFISAWGAQDSFMSPYNWCKYNADFADYFSKQGIDVGWMLSHLVVAVQDIPDAVIDAAGNLTDAAGNVLATAADVAESLAHSAQNVASGVGGVTTVIKYVAPFAAIGLGIWAVDKWVYPIFPKRKAA